MIRRALVLSLFAALAVPATAPAAKRAPAKSRLFVTSLIVPSGRALTPERSFTIRGRIANRGRRGGPALLGLTVRTRRSRRGTQAWALGAKNLLSVRAGSARTFRATVALPVTFPVSVGRRVYVTACVRRRRGARPRCRTARRAITFAARAERPTPAPTPTPTPATTAPDTPPVPAKTYTPGARTLGDRLFPDIGNGGYDAQHYDLALEYEPITDLLSGTTTIDATATQDLSEFSLDFHGLSVTEVKVGDQAATFTREGDKLIVTPPAPIDSGATFTTVVSYGGMIAPYQDPDGSNEGWVPTPDNDGAFVVNEPVGSMSWFPNNNHPTDKALYDVTVTVPGTSTVFGNGRLVETTSSGSQSTWHWREDSPMASYLVTATNGTFLRTTDDTNPDITFEYGVAPSLVAFQPTLEESPGMVDFHATNWGAYPFTSSGGVVDVSDVGYALESQTRPMYAAVATDTTVAHELAHQWFGDSVSPSTWSDIWLNEGPAEFSSWLWDERENGGTTTEAQFDSLYASSSQSWDIPPAAPRDASEMFDSDAMYNRGAMVMEALRQIIGEDAFFGICRTWLQQHAYDDASTADFIALVKAESGKDPARLDEFFQQWLYTSYPSGEKPDITPDTF